MNLVQLIESVKKQSNIYKNLHDDDDEYLKEWQKVAEECEITSDEAQDQWNVLLLEYMEYLRGNHDFSMAKYMDFIQPHLFTIIEDDVIDEEELLNILDEGRTRFETEAGVSAKKCSEAKDKSLTNDETPQTKEDQQTQEIVCCVKKEVATSIAVPLPIVAQVSQSPPQPQNEHNIHKESSFSNMSSMELIFLGYAKQLQKMPLHLQLQTKRKIADIMDEAELKMIEKM